MSELSTVEQHVMLAIIRVRPGAYGIAIADELEKRTGRMPSLGSIYAALDRLQERGMLSSRKGDPSPERGGRRKLLFDITARGSAALQQSLRDLHELQHGVDLKGVLA